jgi:hypothetical protein
MHEHDVLDRASNQIWIEIRDLLDRRKHLNDRDRERLDRKIAHLKRVSARYRTVLRDEAIARMQAAAPSTEE